VRIPVSAFGLAHLELRADAAFQTARGQIGNLLLLLQRRLAMSSSA